MGVEAQDWEAPMVDAAWLPATCAAHLENCKAQCILYDFGGFCVRDGRARFWQGTAPQLKAALVESEGATTYAWNGAGGFCFVGAGTEALEFKTRFEAWVTGQLISEINASAEEVKEVEERASIFAQGVCARSQRVYTDFGMTVKSQRCAVCSRRCANKGCTGCRRFFCWSCFFQHRGTAPNIKWRYEDISIAPFRSVAAANHFRYSDLLSLDAAIEQMWGLEKSSIVRPIHLYVLVRDLHRQDHVGDNPTAARNFLEDLKAEDAMSSSNPDLPYQSFPDAARSSSEDRLSSSSSGYETPDEWPED